MSAARTSRLLGKKAWAGAIGVAVLLHVPLLWLQLDRSEPDADAGPVIELLLSPPEPIPVSPPSEWADALELKWTLSDEVVAQTPPPDFEPITGRAGGAMALSGQLTGLPPRSAVTTAAPKGPSPETPPSPQTAASEDVLEPVSEPPRATAQDTADDSDALDAAIAQALSGTPAFRQADQIAPPPPVEPPRAAPASSDDAIATALAGTAAVRRPQALPPAAREALDQANAPPAPPRNDVQAPLLDAPNTVAQEVPNATAEAPAAEPNDTDRRYDPDSAPGAYTADRDAFFSQLAEHLFDVNDARLSATPYTRRRIVDIRFSIDRAGRVMRVWTTKPVQGPSVEVAKQVIWNASPVPRLAPEMPQTVLELTFPVVVGLP